MPNLFLSYFIHPDGTIGGEYGSRNTEIFFPAGFEILRHEIPLAGSIADTIYNNIGSGRTVLLNAVDTGNLIPLMTNYLIASNERQKSHYTEDKKEKLPAELNSVNAYFQDAKIHVKSNENYYAVIGIGKGGVIKVYDKLKKKWIINDAGYIGQTDNEVFISTQMYNPAIGVHFDENEIEITTDFFKISRELPTPRRFFILRFLNLTIMRSIWFGNLIKKILVRLLITNKKNIRLSLRRNIYLGVNNIRISDSLSCNKNINLRWLEYGIPFKTIHMASSKYFHNLMLENYTPKRIDIERLNREKRISHIQEFNLDQ